MAAKKVVPRCSRIPINDGFSPGAEFCDINFKELICDRVKTVAATNQGNPNSEQISIEIETINKSK